MASPDDKLPEVLYDPTQVPDAHGLSADSMRGSEHHIDAPIYANVDGQMRLQDRADLSFHQRNTLAVKGRGPDAPDPVDITYPDAPNVSTDQGNAQVMSVLERIAAQQNELSERLNRMESRPLVDDNRPVEPPRPTDPPQPPNINDEVRTTPTPTPPYEHGVTRDHMATIDEPPAQTHTEFTSSTTPTVAPVPPGAK